MKTEIEGIIANFDLSGLCAREMEKEPHVGDSTGFWNSGILAIKAESSGYPDIEILSMPWLSAYYELVAVFL